MWGPQTWEFVSGKTGSMVWVRSESPRKWGKIQEKDLLHSSIPSSSLSLDRFPGSRWGKSPVEGREEEKQKSSFGEQMQDPKKYHGVHVLLGCDKHHSSFLLQGVWHALEHITKGIRDFPWKLKSFLQDSSVCLACVKS